LAAPVVTGTIGYGVDQDRAGVDPERMAECIYFLHPPRDNFAATMTDQVDQTYVKVAAEWRYVDRATDQFG
jgi:hypothetical protein